MKWKTILKAKNDYKSPEELEGLFDKHVHPKVLQWIKKDSLQLPIPLRKLKMTGDNAETNVDSYYRNKDGGKWKNHIEDYNSDDTNLYIYFRQASRGGPKFTIIPE
tara:strand:- start:11 stop:328 length:318 start_codon:yes stop_codon:yes gene_type:complete